MSRSAPREPIGQVQEAVREWYGGRFRGRTDDSHYPTGRAGAESLGYERTAIDAAPTVVVKDFCGVGNPCALGPLAPGEAVLDVGCGGGLDVYVAAQHVGPRGRVFGIDLTPDMAARARRGLDEAGLSWASAEVGSAEEIPCGQGSQDVVISNGALNLVPDKERAFREIHRVLRPGGRLQFADVVRSGGVPREAAGDPDAWSR